MKKILVLFGLMMALILTACGGTSAPSVAAVSGESTAVGASGKVRLSEDYSDALSVQSQLAIGTLQLENGDNAVDDMLAADLLPLWEAVQSLANSETAADAEVTAVINQIQDTMTPEQITAIADMKITQDSLETMLADGTITMGRGAMGRQGNGESSGFSGGGPGGGIPGGGPGGGGMPGGGMPGGGFDGDPSAAQTRMAEGMAGGDIDMSQFQTVAMTGAVIRMLQVKTGAASADNFSPGGGIWGEAITAVSEATGLSEEEIQTAMNEGKTLAEIIEANGGDMEAIKATLIESLADSDFLQDQDPAEFITNFLEGGGFGPPAAGNE